MSHDSKNRSLSRRAMLETTLIGLAAAACKNTPVVKQGANSATNGSNNPYGNSTGEPMPTAQPTALPTALPTWGATPIPTASPLIGDACDTPRVNKLKFLTQPVLQTMVPTIKVFGDPNAASLLAIGLTANSNFRAVTVMFMDGRLIAVHIVNATDKFADGRYRPILLDNLFFKGQTSVMLLLSDQSTSYTFECVLTYNELYKNQPVYHLGTHRLPNAYAAKQSVLQFGQDTKTFVIDSTRTYPSETSKPRNLHLAQKSSTWTPGAGIKGDITDVFGTAIDLKNGGLANHQTFCTYVVENEIAFRTMFRVG